MQTKRFEMKKTEVVFMYKAQDMRLYEEYGATVLAWGGAHTMDEVRKLTEARIHATGTMWCLTAWAEELHKDPDLMDATVRDISGEKVVVPWLPDFTYEGTPSYWSCTNHPAFRAHMRKKVCEAMAGGAFGLHVDDHLGSASPAVWWGGCFCDYCMSLFASYLKENTSVERLRAAGLDSLDGFDYRNLVRKHAVTKEEYIQKQGQIPLNREFVDFHLQAAALNVKQLGELAEEIVGRPVTLSANTGMPQLPHTVVTPYLTYLVGEIEHHADHGTGKLLEVVKGYRMAEALGKPLAATACGWDNAYIAEHQCENLMRLWIALAYACGQRFMTPAKVWCYTPEKGTHWYEGPSEAYAPMYRFIRDNARLFDEFETVGSLAVPEGLPIELRSYEGRQAFQDALERTSPSPMMVGDKLWAFPRRHERMGSVIHLINLDYVQDGDEMIVREKPEIIIPRCIAGDNVTKARYYRYDQEPQAVDIKQSEDEIRMEIPSISIWGIIEFL